VTAKAANLWPCRVFYRIAPAPLENAMLPVVRWLLPASILFVGLFACAADKEDKSEAKLSKEEKAILDLTNAARAKEDLPPLKADGLLMEAARAHAANMAKQMKVEHQLDNKRSGQRIADASYKAAASGENIGQSPRLAVKEVFEQWMKSKAHKGHILGKYEETGIGLARDTDGAYYYCQVFAVPEKK
jgi:uncharacterized protein YkwD